MRCYIARDYGTMDDAEEARVGERDSFLIRVTKALEDLRNEATGIGGDLALLAYLLDMAWVEAVQLSDREPPTSRVFAA